jgi:hypothetical protein
VDNRRAPDGGSLRRWIDVAVFLLALAAAVWLVPRLSPRSPLAIVALCVVAILTMKLVERRIRQLFRRWAERQAARPPR